MTAPLRLLGLAAALLGPAAPLSAQEAPLEAAPEAASEAPEPTAGLSVELNGAESVDGSCRLTFLVENGLGADLAALSLETVVLTAEGTVDQLTLFDFGALPAGRPRVRQFDLAGLACEAIGQVLINGVTACEGVEEGACLANLRLSSRSDVELIG